jgi:hypothetical protein
MISDWGVAFIMMFFLLWIAIAIGSIFVSMSNWKFLEKFKKHLKKQA